jgi:hypothetical protein
MAKPIRGIDIYVPLDYNNGEPIPATKFISLEGELLRRFGGVTSLQRKFPLRGVWYSGTEIYYDEVIVFSAMDLSETTQLECLRYLQRLKERLKKKFDQLEILITVTDMLAI